MHVSSLGGTLGVSGMPTGRVHLRSHQAQELLEELIKKEGVCGRKLFVLQ